MVYNKAKEAALAFLCTVLHGICTLIEPRLLQVFVNKLLRLVRVALHNVTCLHDRC